MAVLTGAEAGSSGSGGSRKDASAARCHKIDERRAGQSWLVLFECSKYKKVRRNVLKYCPRMIDICPISDYNKSIRREYGGIVL